MPVNAKTKGNGKGGKANTSAGRGTGQSQVQPTPPAAVPLVPSATAKHLLQIHEDLTAVRNCPLFQDLETFDALTIEQGGCQTPFNLDECKTVLGRPSVAARRWLHNARGAATGGTGNAALVYKCGFNLMHHDIMWLATPHVPISSWKIREIQRFHLDPQNPPHYFHVDLCLALDLVNPDWKLAVRLSPPEPWYALVNTVATAVRMSLSDSILRGWKNVLLTISACIEDIPPGDARFWRAQNLR